MKDLSVARSALFYRLVLSSPFAEILQAWGEDKGQAAPTAISCRRRSAAAETPQRQYYPTPYFAAIWGVTPKAARKILAKLGGREIGNGNGHRWHIEALKLREAK